MIQKLYTIILLFFCGTGFIYAQSDEVRNQTVRGYIVDRASGYGIVDAEVELLNFSPRKSTRTTENGEFVLEDVPVGHQRFRVAMKGYYESVHSELIVAGKEAAMVIPMDEELAVAVVTVEAERTVGGKKELLKNEKMMGVDEINIVSTRQFNIEEVTRYVGGIGDPARIVTNFPGLFNVDDQQNYIVSRGNTPYGIGWEIEGVPIENPHHFATIGNTGGIFPLLNNNLLDNSDFVNGAMPAHYANSFSGVFDINMRKGNNRSFEFAGQLSLYGIEAVAEGPFKKGASSFAVAYRYGIFSLMQLIGLDIGTNAIPEYQDLNFKIDIPTRGAGKFSIFGIGGLSKINILNENRDTSDQFAERNIDLYIESNNALVGVNHLIYLNKNTSIKTTASYVLADYTSIRDTIIQDSIKEPYYLVEELRHQFRLSSTINSKVSKKLLVRGGVYGELLMVNVDDRSLQTGVYDWFADDKLITAGGFFEAEYKFSPKLRGVVGVAGRWNSLNKDSWAAEPRMSLSWQMARRHRLTFGYGWHSKTQPMTMLFYVRQKLDGSYDNSNRGLAPTRSHHAVLSYDVYLHKYWGLKANVYAQYNTDIAVTPNASSFSLTNYGAFGIYPEVTGLVNEGVGFNYGFELALEKFFSQGFYGLVGGSYTRALYSGSDGVWRSASFDVMYLAQFVGGKEFKIGKLKRNTFYFDLRYNGHGGQPYTPILLEESQLAGAEIRDVNNAYSQRLKPYNRIDVRLGMRFNHRKKKISHHLYIEMMNVANFRNDLQIVYNVDSEKIIRSKQFGFVPNLFYQIKF